MLTNVSRKCTLICLLLTTIVFLCLYFPLGSGIYKAASSLDQVLPMPQIDPIFRFLQSQPPTHPPHFCLSLLPCDWTPETVYRPIRPQTFIHCNQSSAFTFVADVDSNTTSSTPSLAAHERSCLKRVIQTHCYDENMRIPRVAHYVRFGAFDMPYSTFLSVLSVVRFLRPCLVLVHGDALPSGRYWRALVSLVPNVLHVQMARPRQVMGHVIKQVEHSSDVARLSIMREYGGIYLDTDHLVLRSLDDLRNYTVVMGTETGVQLGNGFFLSAPEAKFLLLWQANYSDFNDEQWAEHSTIRPKRLSLDYPHLVHVVDSFFRPNYAGMPAMFDRKLVPRYDWSQHYGVHLYRKVQDVHLYGKLQDRLHMQDSVVADMARHVLFGDSHACWRSRWRWRRRRKGKGEQNKTAA